MGVEETEARLTKELVEACREFCSMTWDEALNAAGVPADSPLRRPESVYFHPHIRASTDDALSDAPDDAKASDAEAKDADSSIPVMAVEARGPEAEAKGDELVAEDKDADPPLPEA